MTNDHPLHKAVYEKVKKVTEPINGIELIADKACFEESNANIPLFDNADKSSSTRMCQVDMLILKKKEESQKIKVIIEIEESNIKPLHIMGKFFVSYLSECYIPKDKRAIGFDKTPLFIQVVDKSRLKEASNKPEQMEYIKNKIIAFMEDQDSKFDYKLYVIEGRGDEENLEKLADDLRTAIQ